MTKRSIRLRVFSSTGLKSRCLVTIETQNLTNKMKSIIHPQRARTRLPGFLATTALLIATSVSLHATLPTPLVQLHFDEGAGTTTTNVGSLGGSAVFVQNSGFPEFTNLVATGVFTPGANTASVDFGDLGASHGAEQVNLTTDPSIVPDGTLGTNISGSFTLCGWVNARSMQTGYGGNRLLCALPSAWGSGGFPDRNSRIPASISFSNASGESTTPLPM